MDGTFVVGPHDEVGPLEHQQPRRKSSNIPLPESHVQRTRSEVQLCEDMASAEHREWNMFSRVVMNGRIRERPPSRVGTVDGATAESMLTPPPAWTDDDARLSSATATPRPPPPNPPPPIGGGATEALKNLGLVGNPQNTAWSDSSGFDDSGFQHQQQQQFFHQPLHQYQPQPQQTSSNYAGAASASSSSSFSSSPLTHNFATAAAYAVAATTATTAALPNALQQYTYSSFASMGTVEEETGIFDFDMDM